MLFDRNEHDDERLLVGFVEEHECERERQRMIQCVVCLLELLVQVGFVTPSTTAYLRHTTHTYTCSLTLLLSAFSPLPPSRTHSHSKPNTHIYTYTHFFIHLSELPEVTLHSS